MVSYLNEVIDNNKFILLIDQNGIQWIKIQE